MLERNANTLTQELVFQNTILGQGLIIQDADIKVPRSWMPEKYLELKASEANLVVMCKAQKSELDSYKARSIDLFSDERQKLEAMNESLQRKLDKKIAKIKFQKEIIIKQDNANEDVSTYALLRNKYSYEIENLLEYSGNGVYPLENYKAFSRVVNSTTDLLGVDRIVNEDFLRSTASKAHLFVSAVCFLMAYLRNDGVNRAMTVLPANSMLFYVKESTDYLKYDGFLGCVAANGISSVLSNMVTLYTATVGAAAFSFGIATATCGIQAYASDTPLRYALPALEFAGIVNRGIVAFTTESLFIIATEAIKASYLAYDVLANPLSQAASYLYDNYIGANVDIETKILKANDAVANATQYGNRTSTDAMSPVQDITAYLLSKHDALEYISASILRADETAADAIQYGTTSVEITALAPEFVLFSE